MKIYNCTIYRENKNGEEIEIEVEVTVSGRHIESSREGPEEWPEVEYDREDLTRAEEDYICEQIIDMQEC